jgi:hypothetical protein
MSLPALTTEDVGLVYNSQGDLARWTSSGRAWRLNNRSAIGADVAMSLNPIPALFALGNPSLSDEALRRLGTLSRAEASAPGADEEREVAALAQIYGRATCKILTREQAREETLKADAVNYRITFTWRR